MSKLLLFSLILLVCAQFASANSINSPSVPSLDSSTNLPPVGDISFFGYCGYTVNLCNYFLGMEGSPGSGSGSDSANALGTAAINFSFVTAPALTWSDEGGNGYEASFGYGGSFQITLPDGLVLNGVVTSGEGGTGGTLSIIDVNFFGQWSNGQYAYGEVVLQQTPNGTTESFSEQPAPEPSSFALLGTGIAGVWGLRKKFTR